MSSIPRYDPVTIARLHEAGAHLVLCRPDKRPARRWRSWRPSVERCQRHAGLLGVVPHSVGGTVLDVDVGDPDPIRRDHMPGLELPTRRGVHMWYRDATGRRSRTWMHSGAAGDVRGDGGYVCLHSDESLHQLADLVRADHWPGDPYPAYAVASWPRRPAGQGSRPRDPEACQRMTAVRHRRACLLAEVARLRHAQGWTVPEIARSLGRCDRTVQRWVHDRETWPPMMRVPIGG